MNLTINNYPVDFELEGETNLPEIINSITGWAKDRQLIFTEVQLDDDSYLINEVPAMDVDDIDRINCLVHSKADVIFSSISEGTSYCDRAYVFIKETLEKNGAISSSELGEFRFGLEWLVEVILKVVQLIEIDIEEIQYKDKTISTYIDDINALIKTTASLSDEKQIAVLLDKNKDILATIKNIFKIVISSEEMKQMVIHNVESPDIIINALAGLQQELPAQLTNIEDIAIAYQTGKDSEGAEKLNIFIDFIYRYIKICYQVVPLFGIHLADIEVNGTSLEEKNAVLQELLTETTEIFENNDIISLSDILEYEIKPSLENLPDYVAALLERIDNSPDNLAGK